MTSQENLIFLLIKKTIEKDISSELFEKSNSLKGELVWNLIILNFERQCLDVHILLMTKKLFLRAYELREKIGYLIHKATTKN